MKVISSVNNEGLKSFNDYEKMDVDESSVVCFKEMFRT
jgi:hypothetical protein